MSKEIVLENGSILPLSRDKELYATLIRTILGLPTGAVFQQSQQSAAQNAETVFSGHRARVLVTWLEYAGTTGQRGDVGAYF